MLLLLVLVLFAPLLSPYVLPPTMLILERMLATDQPGWWGTGYHYNSAVVMALFCASVDAVHRLRRRRRAARWSPGRTWAAACALLAVGLVPFFPLRDVFDPAWYRGGARENAAAAAIAAVPDGALVEAANQVGPNLSARTRVVMWRPMPRRAPWVVADVATPQPIFKSLEEQQADVAELRARGYRLVMEREGYIVLHLADTPCEEVASPALLAGVRRCPAHLPAR